MKRKVSSKVRTSHKKYSSSQWLFVGILTAGVLLSSLAVVKASTTQRVLGAHTLLAQGGDDSSGGGDSSSGGSGTSGGSGSSGGSGGTSVSSGDSGSGGSRSITGESGPQELSVPQNQSVSGGMQVDCVGPDGKHFTTNFSDCAELNQKWGKSHFTFTRLGSSTSQQFPTPPRPPELENEDGSAPAAIRLPHQFSLDSIGSQLRISNDRGKLRVHTSKDGKDEEVSLNTHDLIEKINDALKDKDIEVASGSGDTLEIHQGSVSAQSHFPLSIDTSTNQLIVTTPAGTKAVAVLPAQAVQNLLSKGILSQIQSQSSSDSASIQQTVQLVLNNNNPEFEVQGVQSKRLFGIIPMSFAKRVFVSAETGNVTTIDESTLSKILERLSF